MTIPFDTRFAPTPSGYLHQGNGCSFVLTWALARRSGGRIHLRIDDVDRARYRPSYVEDILATLAWLGLDYDTGPRSLAEFEAQYSQTLRFASYLECLERLQAQGVVYACLASRQDLARNRGQSPYRDGSLALDTPGAALRLRLDPSWKASWREGPAQDLRSLYPAQHMPDPVLRRRDGSPAYHLASLWEDVQGGIRGIVRGQDLEASTGLQICLARLLGWEAFGEVWFWHHPLVLDEAGQKLSKSLGAAALRSWRELGREPWPIWAEVAAWLDLKNFNKPSDLLI